MYDLPAVRDATDAWWAGLARHFRAAGIEAVPASLARDPVLPWSDPGLLFSQTCGYPLTHELAGRVRLLCTPCHAAPGCEGPRYRSVLIARTDRTAESLADLRGAVCAFNSTDSHSGWNVLRRMVAALAHGGTFFRDTLETGGHAASVAAVAAGDADLCAVDCVTHALLARHAPEQLHGTRVLEYSPDAPGLPYIAGEAVSEDTARRLRAAIREAVADPVLAPARAELLIDDVEELPLAAYDEIPAMEREAISMGYPALR